MDILEFGLGLIPGVGDAQTVLGIIDVFDGEMSAEKFLKNVLAPMLEITFGRAAKFLKVAEIVSYGTLALGYRNNTKIYYESTKRFNDKV